MNNHKKYSAIDRSLPKAHKDRGLDWYVKWTASIILLCAFSLRGNPEYALYDGILSLIGVALWFWVSMLWNDRALIMLNAVGFVLILRNLIAYTVV